VRSFIQLHTHPSPQCVVVCTCLLELLLHAELRAVAALLLPAVHGLDGKAGIAPTHKHPQKQHTCMSILRPTSHRNTTQAVHTHTCHMVSPRDHTQCCLFSTQISTAFLCPPLHTQHELQGGIIRRLCSIIPPHTPVIIVNAHKTDKHFFLTKSRAARRGQTTGPASGTSRTCQLSIASVWSAAASLHAQAEGRVLGWGGLAAN